ncbi:MAG: radical SAM protein, partial [Clostridia bacterium]|nr:radical SAM protein [Clostridia bacterium]
MVSISGVENGSLAARAGIAAGDKLVSVNGNEVCDVLDYRFYLFEPRLEIKLLRNGEEYSVIIKKPRYDDIGLEFSTYLMDEKKRCRNNCVFCFIDQNPKGMRETVYFKDDDERLSFLQGNYITLTNLRESDIDRIIKMRISPVNISVHTTNPELRCKMMRNRFAGECLEYIKKLDEAGININAQLVLCRGINDGAELERSLADLSALKHLDSAAMVPCGLTGHREGLYELQPYDAASAAAV